MSSKNSPNLKTAIVPVLLVAIGGGALLQQFDWLPEISEVWSWGLLLVLCEGPLMFVATLSLVARFRARPAFVRRE